MSDRVVVPATPIVGALLSFAARTVTVEKGFAEAVR